MRPTGADRARRALAAGALLVALSAAGKAWGDSLLDLLDADTLATLGAPEGLSATRRGAVLYPAPGLPALVHPGDEVVARVRVRRALTPPPGVQQARILRPWSARLVARVAVAAPLASPDPALPLTVVQIRPEDEGFAYRVRLRIPPWTTPGVYDLELAGPGFRDTSARAVRVLVDDDRPLVLYVAASGGHLAEEAEALWLLDPAAVLVPGGLLDAERALARWPVPTFAVPSTEESTARRCLSLEPEVAAAASEAARCPTEGAPGSAPCLVEALGGAARLDPCGDALITYVRRAGPPVFAVGLGAVTLLGAQTFDGPPASRAEVSLRLLGHASGATQQLAVDPPPAAGPSAAQAAWLVPHARRASGLVLLAPVPPERWSRTDPAVAEAGAALTPVGDRVVVVSATPGGAAPAAGSPSLIRLDRVPAPPRREPEQIWGLDPGRYQLGAVERREPERPAATEVASSADGGGVVLRIADPPRDSMRFRVVVPSGGRGYEVTGQGRDARLVGAAPAHGDPCRDGPVLLEVEVDAGDAGPTSVRIEALEAPARPTTTLRHPADRSVVVGAPVRFEVAPADGRGEIGGLVAWDLGDGSLAVGAEVEHRYRQRGWVRVCALHVAPDGGQAEPVTLDLEVLAQGVAARRSMDRLGAPFAVGAGALLGVGLLLLLARGNIFGTRRR